MLTILSNKAAKIIFKNWFQFFFLIKAADLKQQISNFFIRKF